MCCNTVRLTVSISRRRCGDSGRQGAGAKGFQIRGRAAGCVPWGYFSGCEWQRPVMTKAGGFGDETTLRKVLHFIEEKSSD
jgi:hypothetical protein